MIRLTKDQIKIINKELKGLKIESISCSKCRFGQLAIETEILLNKPLSETFSQWIECDDCKKSEVVEILIKFTPSWLCST